jgi:hypothetical protein
MWDKCAIRLIGFFGADSIEDSRVSLWAALISVPGKIALSVFAPIARLDGRPAVKRRVLRAFKSMLNRWLPRLKDEPGNDSREEGRKSFSLEDGDYIFSSQSATLFVSYPRNATGSSRTAWRIKRKVFQRCAALWVSLVFETINAANQMGLAPADVIRIAEREQANLN